jgi:hypothetical protein
MDGTTSSGDPEFSILLTKLSDISRLSAIPGLSKYFYDRISRSFEVNVVFDLISLSFFSMFFFSCSNYWVLELAI